MATKSDFTPEEWEVIQYAMMDTMAWISIVDPQFFASFKEATAGAKYLVERDADEHEHAGSRSCPRRPQPQGPRAAGNRHQHRGSPRSSGSRSAVALISEKAPDDLERVQDVHRRACRCGGGGLRRHQRQRSRGHLQGQSRSGLGIQARADRRVTVGSSSCKLPSGNQHTGISIRACQRVSHVRPPRRTLTGEGAMASDADVVRHRGTGRG